MKHIKIIVLVLSLIVTKSYTQNNDLSISEFRGKIKTIDTYVGNKKQKSIDYNEDGNILYYAVGNDLNTGENKQSFSNKYDKKGRKIYSTGEFFITTKKYNDSKNSILEYTLHTLKKDTTFLYFKQFDKNKNLLLDQSIEYTSNQRYLERTTEYKYDTLNRLTFEVYMIKNIQNKNTKTLKTYKKYIYDKDLITKIVSNDAGEEVVTKDFKFLSKTTPLYENLFGYYRFKNDGLTYNNKSEETKIVRYMNKEKSLKQELTFSKKELLLLQEDYEKEKLILKIENKYDNLNNIIERKINDYKKGKTEITKYIITYYTI